VRISFLGSGAAFSSERYNGAVVVDGRILLDGGAPLLPHMARLGIDPSAIETAFITHFHGDHLLGLPPFILHRAFITQRPMTIVGPEGVEETLETLFALCWGDHWSSGPNFRQMSGHVYTVAATKGEVNGIPYETVRLDHGGTLAIGYRLTMPDGRVLSYTGDSEMTEPLERLVEGADIAITEATGPGHPVSHTGWEEAQALAERHPRTRFFFNHLYAGALPGAVSDFDDVTV
jgi:ribonuclease Z